MTAAAPVFDFSKQNITDETTAEYVWHDLPGAPSLILAPAHDSNSAFLDERLRRSIKRANTMVRQPRGAKVEKPTPEQQAADLKKEIEADREADRVLISKTCGRAWGKAPVAVDGTSPDYSEANCYAFFKALPDWLFDPLRSYAQNLYNFVERPVLTEDDGEDVGN